MAKQLSFNFSDSGIRSRLVILEELADLTPVAWSSIRYTGQPGEITRIRGLRRDIERNLAGLEKVIEDKTMPDSYISLARSMRLMIRKQLCQLEVVEKSISSQLSIFGDKNV